jgi:hypothetical protein
MELGSLTPGPAPAAAAAAGLSCSDATLGTTHRIMTTQVTTAKTIPPITSVT